MIRVNGFGYNILPFEHDFDGVFSQLCFFICVLKRLENRALAGRSGKAGSCRTCEVFRGLVLCMFAVVHFDAW